MVLASSLCIHGGDKVVAPPSSARGLIMRHSFDDALMMDTSGMGHHAAAPVSFGPGVFNAGLSAHFDGSNQLTIPHTSHMETSEFCLTFWIYLTGDSTGSWRPIIHKGNYDYERT